MTPALEAGIANHVCLLEEIVNLPALIFAVDIFGGVARLSTLDGIRAHRTKIMKTPHGAIFVGLLTLGFLSGCSHHESSTTPTETLTVRNVRSQTFTISNVISEPFTVTVSTVTNRTLKFIASNASSEPLTVSNASVTITVTN